MTEVSSDIVQAAGLSVQPGAKIKGQRMLGGVQIEFEFPNGWGASVVRHRGSYGWASGLFELAVLLDGNLNYDSGITSNVMGWLTPEDVDGILSRIARLEDAR